jgi:hypothetical protein
MEEPFEVSQAQFGIETWCQRDTLAITRIIQILLILFSLVTLPAEDYIKAQD